METITIQDCTECYATAESIIDVINPNTGLTWIYGKTFEQIRAENPHYATASRMTIEDYCRRKAAKQGTPIQWQPSTKDEYDEMLNCLPPAAYKVDGFLVGEPYDHDVITGAPRFAAYRHTGDKYEKSNRPMTRKEFADSII